MKSGWIFALCFMALLTLSCAKKVLQVESFAESENMSTGDGLVDVVIVTKFKTLFECLLKSQKAMPGSVKIPSGCGSLYMGDLSVMIDKALLFYDLSGNFRQLYGYRLIVRIEKVPVTALDGVKAESISVAAAGFTGKTILGLGVGIPNFISAPLFLIVDSALAEQELERFRRYALEHGMPTPDKGFAEIVWEDYSGLAEAVASFLAAPSGGTGSDTKCAYIVTECRIEKPTPLQVKKWLAAFGDEKNHQNALHD